MTGRPMTLEKHAAGQVSQRLGRVAFEVRRARKKLDADAVHDLRVSIRRFTQALRVFSALLPGREARKIRKQLRAVMKIAGEVRNLDIAREIIAGSKVSRTAALTAELERQRKEESKRLLEALRQFAQRDFTTKWRERLQLEARGSSAP